MYNCQKLLLVVICFSMHASTVMYVAYQLLLEPVFHGKYFLPTKKSISNYQTMEQNHKTKNKLKYGCPRQ